MRELLPYPARSDHSAPGRLDLVARPSRARDLESLVEPAGDCLGEIEEVLRRPAQVEGPGESGVISVVAAAELEVGDAIRAIAVA